MVSGLLERGAHTNVQSAGWNCLFKALWSRRHNALRTLLNNTSLDYNVKSDDWGTLLHVAAWGADIEFLYILMSKRWYELDTAEENRNGYTAMDFAQLRRLSNEEWSEFCCQPRDNDPTEWYSVFEKLLDSITEAQASMAGDIDDKASEEETANGEVSYDSSGEDSIEGDQDGEELWEDAQEDLDGQS